MKIAGLDIGTTGCKLTVFDENGMELGKSYRDYPVCRTAGAHEMDISTMMGSVYAVLEEMAERYPDIAGIGVTSFGETFVMTDSAGKPLHNAMLYTDPRGAEECAALARIAREKGLNVWVYTGYTYEKLLSGEVPGAMALLEQADVLVDGPFLLERKSYAALFRGSGNQRLIDVAASRAAGRAVLWERPDPLAHFVRPEP